MVIIAELLTRLIDAPFRDVEKNVHSIRPANRKEKGSMPSGGLKAGFPPLYKRMAKISAVTRG